MKITHIDAGDLFKLHDTHGFSLTDSLFQCLKDGAVPSNWHNWFRESKKQGWDFDRSCRVIEEAVADSGWKQTADQIIEAAWSIALMEVSGKLPT